MQDFHVLGLGVTALALGIAACGTEGTIVDATPASPVEEPIDDTATTNPTVAHPPSAGQPPDGSTSPPAPPRSAPAKEFYVSLNGNDAADGSVDSPFASLERALEQAGPEVRIWVRGGVYELTKAVRLSASGTAGAPIEIRSFDGEEVVFDFASNRRHRNPPQPRDDDSIVMTGDAVGFLITGDYWKLTDFTVRNAPYYGVRVYGSHNRIERLRLYGHKASGLEITGKDGYTPSNNLVWRCDSFRNFDPQTNGEDADGFAAKFEGLGPGNILRETRAWSNSDDGYDFWYATFPVVIEGAWAFDNGWSRNEWASQLSGRWRGDGMGFKLGQSAAELELHSVAAWGNKGFGIDENGNGSDGGVLITHATLVGKAKGSAIQLSLNDGQPHTVINSVAFDLEPGVLTEIDTRVESRSNSWDGIPIAATDFVSLDLDVLFAEATLTRGLNGELPAIGLAPAPGSALVDAGEDQGRAHLGVAPDLGAFEVE